MWNFQIWKFVDIVKKFIKFTSDAANNCEI